MASSSGRTVRCMVTGEEIPIHDAVPLRQLREPIQALLLKESKEKDPEAYVSQEALNKVRLDRIQQMLKEDKREVTKLEKEVLESLDERSILSRDPLSSVPEASSFGERLADKVATFGGSWAFIITFFCILAAWIGINAFLLTRPYDPFPFILLNLILSCLAAIQAPIIMMSQNRQEAKDRMRSMHDYQINLKAELEVRALHEKLDRLIGHQWQQLLEIQQMQMDMLREMQGKGK